MLYRAHFHSIELQMELSRAGIPYVITSGVGVFEQAHVKDVAAFLKFVVNPRDEVAFKRMARLMQGVGERSAVLLWAAVERALPSGESSAPGSFYALLMPAKPLKIPAKAQKDWQQLAVIRRMVSDLKIPVKIVGYPTVREEDGLALSSRNRLLSPESRLVAPRIYQALIASAMEAEAGETSVTRLRQQLSKELAAIPSAEVDYAEIVDESTLAPLNKLSSRVKARALVAVRLASAKQGSVRLIDNLSLPFRS